MEDFSSFFKSVVAHVPNGGQGLPPDSSNSASPSTADGRGASDMGPGTSRLGSVTTPSVRYAVGMRVRGRVTGKQPYGVFLEIEPGITGLLHKSQMGVGCPAISEFTIGQEVEVRVSQVQAGGGRMAFSCGRPVTNGTSQASKSAADWAQVARTWAEQNPLAAKSAYDYLVRLIEHGPIHGSVLGRLSARFGVPRPVTAWVRLHSEITCLPKTSSPNRQPSIALTTRLSDAGYWANFSVRPNESLANAPIRFMGVVAEIYPMANRCLGVKLESCKDILGAPRADLNVLHSIASSKAAGLERGDRVAGACIENSDGSVTISHLERLMGPAPASATVVTPPRWCALESFPDVKWIRRYVRVATQINDQPAFGVGDVIERLVVPMLGQLGWPVSNANCEPMVLIRGNRKAGHFDLNLYRGNAGEECLVLVIDCCRDATDKEPLGMTDPVGAPCDGRKTRVMWTNGVDWIVFPGGDLSHRADVLKKLQHATPDEPIPSCIRIVFPKQIQMPEDVVSWLEAFASLADQISIATFQKGGMA